MTTILTTGRRKTSTAKVFLSPGSGHIKINNKALEVYFPSQIDQAYITDPLRLLDKQAKYNINIQVKGGGSTGQKGAIRLGISRALTIDDPNTHPDLKQQKMLTRDSRQVERKKYGLRKARKKAPYRKR